MFSVETDTQSEQKDKYVRAVINISAYVFQQCDKGCLVYRIGHVDPAGIIPTSVINSYATKTRDIIEFLRSQCANNFI
jgi:hypothetical protein